MGLKSGALLWNRRRISLEGEGSTLVDTGLTQLNQSFADYSPGEPTLGSRSAPSVPPAPPTPPTAPPPIIVSRVHVVPLAPTDKWAGVTHGEPFVDPTTGRVWVEFFSRDSVSDLNVLFWDPHSIVGPGQADEYNNQTPTRT